MTTRAFAHRGVMLDLGRLIERPEYYKSLLPHLRSWGFNFLQMHFNDDQFCALRFPSHPELASPHAFSADEMRSFCDEARAYGLDVVPELETFGHTRFITSHKAYRHLAENSDPRSGYSAMCVFLPEAQRLLRDLLRDTAEIFRPKIFHVGLDEVGFGAHPLTKKLLKKNAKNQLFSRHLNWVYDEVGKLGCRMAVWGDHFLLDKKEGLIAAHTPKDVLIFDWHYQPPEDPGTMDFFTERGFEVFGTTSTHCSSNRVVSSPLNFANLRRFSGAALRRRSSKTRGKGRVTGMLNTIWCPYRYVPGTVEYPLFVAGYLFSNDNLEPENLAVEFARLFWGLKGTAAKDVGWAMQTLHEVAPERQEYTRIVYGASLNRMADDFSRADEHACRVRLSKLPETERILSSATKDVKLNRERMLDYRVAVEVLSGLYQFGVSGRKRDPGWKRIRESLRNAWRRSRWCDGPHFFGKNKLRNDYDYYGFTGALLRDLNHLAED